MEYFNTLAVDLKRPNDATNAKECFTTAMETFLAFG